MAALAGIMAATGRAIRVRLREAAQKRARGKLEHA
jgi:hypothetical protein